MRKSCGNRPQLPAAVADTKSVLVTGPPAQAGFRPAEIAAAAASATPAINAALPQVSAFANLSADDLSRRAADAFLINGSDNNAAASQFGLPARIGNNLRGIPLFRGNAGLTVDNSGLNARSYSFTGQNTREPSYNRLNASFNLSGPLIIPRTCSSAAPVFSPSPINACKTAPS